MIDLILTIFAWRRGWRWWALLPLAIGLSISFSMGAIIGAFEINISDGEVLLLAAPAQVVLWSALIVMIRITPHRIRALQAQHSGVATTFKLP